MKLIVNADDLGAGREINDAVFDAISSGLVSSATIMANGTFVDDAVQNAKKHPNISFGIHLNITSFSPLKLNKELMSIVDANGDFKNKSSLAETSITGQVGEAIYKEFCNQTERLLSTGLNISHIDSHEHIHTLPAVFPILKRVQRRYNLWKVRISRNIYMPDYRISKALLVKKKIYNFVLRNCFSTKTTSGFGSLTEFYLNAEQNNLPYETVEVMVHPGANKFRDENKLLRDGWFRELPYNIELINYHQL